MRSTWFRLAVTVTALCACADTGSPARSAPEPRVVVVPDEAVCDACRIELEEVATLGDNADVTSIAEDAATRSCSVGALSGGRFVLAGTVGGGGLLVYGREGPAERVIGRPGQGPGEFGTRLRIWVGANDSLYVVDEGNARLQVLSPEGDYERSFTVPARYRPFTRLADGTFLFHRTPTSSTDPMFHRVGPSGDPIESFGQPGMAAFDLESRLLAPSAHGGYWSASQWQYELREWSRPDSLLRVVRRDAAWFPGGVWLTEDVYTRDPPGPHLLWMWDDGSGLLWTWSGVADARWRPNEARSPDPEWLRANFDVIVEVIDVARGALVASRRIDEMVGGVCHSSLMYTVRYADSGDTRVSVLRPRLIGY